jgi:hypothetical protein
MRVVLEQFSGSDRQNDCPNPGRRRSESLQHGSDFLSIENKDGRKNWKDREEKTRDSTRQRRDHRFCEAPSWSLRTENCIYVANAALKVKLFAPFSFMKSHPI